MEANLSFSQRAYVFHRAEFRFLDRQLEYLIEDEKVVFGLSVPYDLIPLKRSFKTYQEQWPRYAILALTPALIVSWAFFESYPGSLLAKILFGLFVLLTVVLAIAKRSVRFQGDVIETAEGKIVIFDGPDRQKIINEIYARRTTELRRKYLAIDPYNSAQAEIQKFRQMKDQDIISEDEYTDAVMKLQGK